MKHITILALTALTLAALTVSCKKSPSFVYDFNISGHATGAVCVTFPGGHVDLDGAAALDFRYGNLDTASVSLRLPKLSNRQALKLSEAADRDVFGKFGAETEAGGKYYLLIDCVAREEMTGAELRWKKVLTNED